MEGKGEGGARVHSQRRKMLLHKISVAFVQCSVYKETLNPSTAFCCILGALRLWGAWSIGMILAVMSIIFARTEASPRRWNHFGLAVPVSSRSL